MWGVARLYLCRGDGKVGDQNGVILLCWTILFGVGVFGVIDVSLLLYLIGLPLSIIDGLMAAKEHRVNGGQWR